MSKSLNPCACSLPEFLGDDGPYSTDCDGTTTRTFAPGHDARLKGYLIRAAVAGEKVRLGTKVLTPMQVADTHGFGYLVQAGIDLADAKANAPKKERKPAVAKASKPKEFLEQQATAKVGRWVKHGVYDTDSETFTYTDAKGNQITLHPGKYSELELV